MFPSVDTHRRFVYLNTSLKTQSQSSGNYFTAGKACSNSKTLDNTSNYVYDNHRSERKKKHSKFQNLPSNGNVSTPATNPHAYLNDLLPAKKAALSYSIQQMHFSSHNNMPFNVSFFDFNQYVLSYLFQTCQYPFIIYGSSAHQWYINQWDSETFIQMLLNNPKIKDLDIRTAHSEEIVEDIKILFYTFCTECVPRFILVDILNALHVETTRIRFFGQVLLDVTYTPLHVMDILLNNASHLQNNAYINPYTMGIVDIYRHLNRPNSPILSYALLKQKETLKWENSLDTLCALLSTMSPSNFDITPQLQSHNLVNITAESAHYTWTGLIAASLLELVLNGSNSKYFGSILYNENGTITWTRPNNTYNKCSYFTNSSNNILYTYFHLWLPNFSYDEQSETCIYDYKPFRSLSRLQVILPNEMVFEIMAPPFIIVELGVWISSNLCGWDENVQNLIIKLIELDHNLASNLDMNEFPPRIITKYGTIIYWDSIGIYDVNVSTPIIRPPKLALIWPPNASTIVSAEYDGVFKLPEYYETPPPYRIPKQDLTDKFHTKQPYKAELSSAMFIKQQAHF